MNTTACASVSPLRARVKRVDTRLARASRTRPVELAISCSLNLRDGLLFPSDHFLGKTGVGQRLGQILTGGYRPFHEILQGLRLRLILDFFWDQQPREGRNGIGGL